MTDASTDERHEPAGGVAGVKERATGWWADQQAQHTWLRHVLESWKLLQRNNGNQYAAAITYFSFLALFPLLLLAVSIVGFVLHSHPAAEQDFFAQISDKVPGQFGKTLKDSLHTAIDARTGVGIVGVVGLLLTGLGWIANLRGAIDGVWGRPQVKRSFIGGKVANLVVLAGLGIGILVSLALTAVGTSLTAQILRAVGFDHIPGSTVILKIIGIVIAVAGDAIIFWWLLVKLPQADVARRTALRGAVLAAAGFEVLKVVGTYTIAHTASSPTYGPFAGVIAILIWIQLVARWMLFCCAWIATATSAERAANSVPIVATTAVPETNGAGPGQGSAVRPSTVGATLVGAGAIAGAVATWAATRSRPDPDDR